MFAILPKAKKTIEGDIFVSSMPVKDLVAGMTGDEPSKEIKYIAENLPYRDFVTVGLLVNKLNLKNETKMKTLNNIVPDCWIYVQETSVKLGRIQIFNNWSPYMVEDPENTVWIGLEYFCAEGDDFWNLSDEECIKLATKELESMGVISSSEVLDSHREKIKRLIPLILILMLKWTSLSSILIHTQTFTASAETVSIVTIIWTTLCLPLSVPQKL